MQALPINWTPVLRKVAELKDWERNPRVITPDAFAKLKARIEARGFHDVVKVDTRDTILSGTQRRKALTEIGVEEVWTMVPDRELTEEEREKVVLESNRNDGDWDWGSLKGFDMPVLLDVGFAEGELRVGLGLDNASDVDLDADRLRILVVMPPETPSLKDRAVIKMPTKEEYDEVKAAVLSGKIGVAEILAAARRA
jgi:hypothetical protein